MFDKGREKQALRAKPHTHALIMKSTMLLILLFHILQRHEADMSPEERTGKQQQLIQTPKQKKRWLFLVQTKEFDDIYMQI